MLRNPPSDLLLLSASLPDIVLKQPVQIENKFIEEEEDPSPLIEPIVKPDSEAKTPIRLIQSRWSTEKKLKKMQVQVLEKVYHRTKRPTVSIDAYLIFNFLFFNEISNALVLFLVYLFCSHVILFNICVCLQKEIKKMMN